MRLNGLFEKVVFRVRTGWEELGRFGRIEVPFSQLGKSRKNGLGLGKFGKIRVSQSESQIGNKIQLTNERKGLT